MNKSVRFNILENKEISAISVYKSLSLIVDEISSLYKVDDDLVLMLDFSTEEDFNHYNTHIDIPHETEENTLIFKYTNVIDLIGKFPSNLLIHKKLSSFLTNETGSLPKCVVYKRHPDAIIPHKSRMSDVGHDIYIIGKHKYINERTILYDTGIALQIPFGYYVEVVPRSSLTKSGYILTNSIGIIDRSYRGNIYISLTKTTVEAINIEALFPFRCCQLILRKQHFMELVEAENENEFTMTDRNLGGYGSTGGTGGTGGTGST